MQASKLPLLVRTIALPALLCATMAAAQAPPPHLAAPAREAQAISPAAPSEKDIQAERRELIRLLRLSPTLTTVVSHDPSLLANQDYVARNNPQLAAFLAAHPEIGRNPDFFLFSDLHSENGDNIEALQRAVWPEFSQPPGDHSDFEEFLHDLAPLLAFVGFLAAFIWLIRVFVENRRWGRIFKLQSEVHGRLIDKFSSSQELAAYMETEAGRRFLEAAPIPVNVDSGQQVPNALARVLTPIQIGVVMILLGAGLLGLRHASVHTDVPMLILGTMILMPGIGFIISAGVTWFLAQRLGLMPANGADSTSTLTRRP
jgi:hypothetical protein